MKNFTLILSLRIITLLCLLVGCADGGQVSTERSGARNPYAGGSTPAEVPCDEELDFFRDSVWTPVLSVQCLGCHNEGGAASDSDFVLREAATQDELIRNFHAAGRMAFERVGSSSALLLRPTGQHPGGHGGGEVIQPGSAQYAALESFVTQVTTENCDSGEGVPTCDEPVPGRRTIRRLTHHEYQNTVRDLLGVESDHAASFSPDTVVHGFDNNSGSLVVSPLLADQYSAAADSIADAAMLHAERFLPACASGSATEACAEQFIREFGERAFRRPVTDRDVGRYLRIFRLGAQEETFDSGIRWVLVGMLQSPSFLYRREIGNWDAGQGLYLLDDYEIASELSYLILASMPDAALFAAARAGELQTPEQILAQAERLLASEGSRSSVRQFVQRWLDLDRLHTVPKDADTYPELSEAGSPLRQSMQGEIDRFVDHVVFESEGTLSELLTADYTFVDDRLAEFYGMSAEGSPDAAGYRRVNTAAEERRGITTLGGYLTTHARPNSSSPVERGLVVRERMLCQELPPPPPGVVAEPPPINPDVTTRERYSAHSTDDACRGCHRLIDPLGFPYEHFDGAGRWRIDDFGHDIDSTGAITETAASDAEFNGNVELSTLLGESPDVHDCFTLQWVRYGYGVSENSRLSCMIDDLAADFRDGSMTIPELIVSLTQTRHFISREGDAPSMGTEMGEDPSTEGTDTGTGTGTGSGDDSSTGDAAEEPAPLAGLEVREVVDSEWAEGFCKKYYVTNSTDEVLSWHLTVDVPGTINDGNPWNATADARSGRVTFRGVDHNRELAPGGTADFGFCATR